MQVCKLQPCEAVGLEYHRLERFWKRLGARDGELALGAAMEDLAILLREATLAWQMSDFPALRMRALGVQGIAERLGMPLLVRVAGDVIALGHDADKAALAATVSRLSRVGERSLLAIWDAQVPTG